MAWSRVVVGVDGSASSARALRWAADEAREHGAELSVVMAYHPPSPRLRTEAGTAPWLERTDWRGDAEAALQKALSEGLGDDSDVSVTSHLVEGSPVSRLIELSENANLLVVGTRGHGGFAGLLLGSVSQHLTAYARCTVAVVR